MPTISHVTERKPTLGDGGGPGKTPRRRGYGGDDGDHGQPEEFLPGQRRLRRYRVGVAVFSMCVTILFAGLASAYIVRQQMGGLWDSDHGTLVSNWRPLTLPYRQLWINSLLLIASSLTLELARRGQLKKAEFAAMGILAPRLQRELPWLGITLLLACGFLAGQLLVWSNLRHQGVYLSGSPSGSFFYLLTGLHAVHLAGGMVVLLYALMGGSMKRKFESQRIAVDATGWYWHFMAVLWFCIFALLHFGKG
ncbi:MAG TPA: heme-copper oxidase subunit III [Verrucomicrobiae bacterium]|jgi:cytochrome c oxidase subunit 3|nr:heme-copper oxidase subunit III [Verrucomicrobiae bacterium]